MKDEIYGHGYYHGENSGYPAEGYSSAHPDWDPWLDLIGTVKPPPGILFDCGTAFGFLPGGAESRGYRALGCDISSYALKQEPSFRDLLLRGDSEKLPLKAASADVVCLFDVLEHLEDPVAAIEEAVRIMKPDGILAGATPDPLFFNLHEETHCFERCPSFWLHHLQRLGMKTVFRFSNIPENFQFMAAFNKSVTSAELDIFNHDYFSKQPEILQIKGPESSLITSVLREGWDSIRQDCRRIKGHSASVYILNSSQSPVECRFEAEVSEAAALPRMQLRLDSLVLDTHNLRAGEINSGIASDNFILPSGGHHIHIELLPPLDWDLPIKSLILEAIGKISPGKLAASLPFDLYQRYRFAGDIVEIIKPSSILDAGGNLGDRDGHLAVSHDFFISPEHHPEKIISSDLRHNDHPDHVPGNALALPFPDSSFDMVVSLDVLEHIPPESRLKFLGELSRVSSRWVLLGAPFSSPEVEEAESALVSDLELHFLSEHSELGLPEERLVTEFFQSERPTSILRFENGSLFNWFRMLPLTQMVFSLHNHRIFSSFNRYYNDNYYDSDCSAPGYRTFFLISMDSIPGPLETELRSIQAFSPEKRSFREQSPQGFHSFPFFQDFLELAESRSSKISDLTFLLSEREKLIKILRGELNQYEQNPVTRFIRKFMRAIRRGA
jgi:SAM-dependent methyltransferase